MTPRRHCSVLLLVLEWIVLGLLVAGEERSMMHSATVESNYNAVTNSKLEYIIAGAYKSIAEMNTGCNEPRPETRIKLPESVRLRSAFVLGGHVRDDVNRRFIGTDALWGAGSGGTLIRQLKNSGFLEINEPWLGDTFTLMSPLDANTAS